MSTDDPFEGMSVELVDSICDAAQIAGEEQRFLDEEWFNDHDFEIFMKPDGTIRLLRESEYFAEVPEGWKRITYDGYENDDLTYDLVLAEIVRKWMDKQK